MCLTIFKHSEESLVVTSSLFHFPCTIIFSGFCALANTNEIPLWGTWVVFFFLEEREDSVLAGGCHPSRVLVWVSWGCISDSSFSWDVKLAFVNGELEVIWIYKLKFLAAKVWHFSLFLKDSSPSCASVCQQQMSSLMSFLPRFVIASWKATACSPREVVSYNQLIISRNFAKCFLFTWIQFMWLF